MSTEKEQPKTRVYGLIDGFNLYHAIQDCAHYQKYKWLCLRTLIQHFVRPEEHLVGVHYFTAYPYWGGDAKRLRHQTYVNAIHARGVGYTLGEFKAKILKCQASCHESYERPEEKQTDVNIATTIIDFANIFDKLILVTADSDQVPAIRLLRRLHPQKQVFILPPIGRNSKELVAAAGNKRMIMTEDILLKCQMPNPVDIIRGEKITAQLWRPADWPHP